MRAATLVLKLRACNLRWEVGMRPHMRILKGCPHKTGPQGVLKLTWNSVSALLVRPQGRACPCLLAAASTAPATKSRRATPVGPRCAGT